MLLCKETEELGASQYARKNASQVPAARQEPASHGCSFSNTASAYGIQLWNQLAHDSEQQVAAA